MIILEHNPAMQVTQRSISLTLETVEDFFGAFFSSVYELTIRYINWWRLESCECGVCSLCL